MAIGALEAFTGVLHLAAYRIIPGTGGGADPSAEQNTQPSLPKVPSRLGQLRFALMGNFKTLP
jgi:hypothetical protein